jgi:hypothetical protein
VTRRKLTRAHVAELCHRSSIEAAPAETQGAAGTLEQHSRYFPSCTGGNTGRWYAFSLRIAGWRPGLVFHPFDSICRALAVCGRRHVFHSLDNDNNHVRETSWATNPLYLAIDDRTTKRARRPRGKKKHNTRGSPRSMSPCERVRTQLRFRVCRVTKVCECSTSAIHTSCGTVN